VEIPSGTGTENTFLRSWGGGSQPHRAAQDCALIDVSQRWYAQSESIIIKTHSKTIVLQDYRFYLLVFFLSLLLFTVQRCKTIVLKDLRIFILVFLYFLKTIRRVWFYLLVLCVQIKFN
jgi:hypothetical protein